jgi:hypothetical protein
VVYGLWFFRYWLKKAPAITQQVAPCNQKQETINKKHYRKAPEKSGAFSFQLKPTIRKTVVRQLVSFPF